MKNIDHKGCVGRVGYEVSLIDTSTNTFLQTAGSNRGGSEGLENEKELREQVMTAGIMTANVPSHWKMFRLGQLFEERKQKGSDAEFPALSVTKQGIVPQLDTAAKTDDGENRQIIRAGDFVINSRSDRKGSSGLSDRDGSTSQISIVLQPRNIFPRFAHHLLRSTAFQEEFYKWGHGIVADLWTTRFRDMKNIHRFQTNKQREIAEFLIAKLPALMNYQKKRSINLQKEKAEALLGKLLLEKFQTSLKHHVRIFRLLFQAF